MPTLKYETDSGVVGRTRVDRTAVTVYGTEPTAAAEPGIWIYKSGSRRKAQLRTRNVVLRRVRGTIGVAPNQIEILEYARASVGTLTQFEALDIGESLTVFGKTWTISDKQNEG